MWRASGGQSTHRDGNGGEGDEHGTKGTASGGQGRCPWIPLKGLSPLRIPVLRPFYGLKGG